MSHSETEQQKLDQLFPAPSLPPSPLSPQRLPGANPESLAALRDVLKDNHQRYHVFFNNTGFHNHTTHRALAIYALGGSAPIIRDYYKRDARIQRPAFESPEPITEDNFVEHLADENFYQGYVTFFSKQISERGAANTLEEYIFSEKYNFQKGRDASGQPEMLVRLFSGLVHPMIHVGHGAEFGLKGMLAEGLAMTAVHDVVVRGSMAPSAFVPASTDANGVDHITKSLSTLALDAKATTGAPTLSKTGGVHAFDIVARMLKDDRLKSKTSAEYADQFWQILAEYSPSIKEHTAQWTVDLNQPGEVERKMEEVVWLSSLIYGVGGLKPDGHQSDFFLMHLVTSSLFLPSLTAYLSPRSQVLLLRGYLFIVLTWWILRGRPALDIKSFMTTTSVEPSVPTTPVPGTPLTTETTPTPNPFLPILQSAIGHPMDHVIKIQRTFAHFNTLYGTRPAGYFKGTELEDAALLDGTLFLRAALLTADFVGWAREGKVARQFSNEGFHDA